MLAHSKTHQTHHCDKFTTIGCNLSQCRVTRACVTLPPSEMRVLLQFVYSNVSDLVLQLLFAASAKKARCDPLQCSSTASPVTKQHSRNRKQSFALRFIRSASWRFPPLLNLNAASAPHIEHTPRLSTFEVLKACSFDQLREVIRDNSHPSSFEITG